MRNIFRRSPEVTPLCKLSPAAKRFEAGRRALDAAYAAHLALSDLHKGSEQTAQDHVLSSNPGIVDFRHRHPDHHAGRPQTSADVDPYKYLNGFHVRSHVTLIPVETEQPEATQEVI